MTKPALPRRGRSGRAPPPLGAGSQTGWKSPHRVGAALPDPIRHSRGRAGGPFHHHEAGQFKVPDQPVRRDPGHHVIGVMDTPPPLKPQGESEGLGQFFLGSGSQGFILGHGED